MEERYYLYRDRKGRAGGNKGITGAQRQIFSQQDGAYATGFTRGVYEPPPAPLTHNQTTSTIHIPQPAPFLQHHKHYSHTTTTITFIPPPAQLMYHHQHNSSTTTQYHSQTSHSTTHITSKAPLIRSVSQAALLSYHHQHHSGATSNTTHSPPPLT